MASWIQALHRLSLAQPLIELFSDVSVTSHVTMLSRPCDIIDSVFVYLLLSSCALTC